MGCGYIFAQIDLLRPLALRFCGHRPCVNRSVRVVHCNQFAARIEVAIAHFFSG
jgi:hypothetical protein